MSRDTTLRVLGAVVCFTAAYVAGGLVWSPSIRPVVTAAAPPAPVLPAATLPLVGERLVVPPPTALQQEYLDGLLQYCAEHNLTESLLGAGGGAGSGAGGGKYEWAPAADGSVRLVVVVFGTGAWPKRFWAVLFARMLQPYVRGRLRIVITKDMNLMCQPSTLTLSLVGQFWSNADPKTMPFPKFAPVVYARYAMLRVQRAVLYPLNAVPCPCNCLAARSHTTTSLARALTSFCARSARTRRGWNRRVRRCTYRTSTGTTTSAA